MKRYHVIILAGGEPGPLSELAGHDEKALIEIHGRAMVERVIDAFADCERVDQIVVVGSSRLSALPAMARVRKRLPPTRSVVQNLVLAIGYIKQRLLKGASVHDGYVISFCDAVFLDAAAVDQTLAAIEASEGEVVLHYVERETFRAADLPTERTYLPLGDRRYTGSTIYYLRSLTRVLSALPKLAQLRADRKSPGKLLEAMGAAGCASLAELEQAVSARLEARVRLLESPLAALGLDVDKPSDLELARRILAP